MPPRGQMWKVVQTDVYRVECPFLGNTPRRGKTTMHDGGAPRGAWAIRDSAVMGGVYYGL